MKYKALSIAGFDGSGGAGLQADLKTFSAFGCYGMTVLTALPVQNTCGVRSCHEIPLLAIKEQLSAIFDDIRPDSIKIGMLFKSDIIEVVADFLQQHAAGIPIVLDPVMVAKSGDRLLRTEAVHALKTKLIPLVTLLTPNLPEADELTGRLAESSEDMPAVAQQLLALGPKAVLLKGGHLGGETSDDLYVDHKGHEEWLKSPRILTENTHGTGCTLSAAIASCLAMGVDLKDACHYGKRYLQGALQAAKKAKVGKGCGPVHHFYHVWPTLHKITGDSNDEIINKSLGFVGRHL